MLAAAKEPMAQCPSGNSNEWCPCLISSLRHRRWDGVAPSADFQMTPSGMVGTLEGRDARIPSRGTLTG